MSCFKLPGGPFVSILICWFGNSGGGWKDGQRKPSWVSWEVMTMPKGMGGMGFKYFELFNLSLLARHAWRILKNRETLSARILKAVDFPNTTILQAEVGSHPSQIWRSIIEGRDILKQEIIKRIGNGESTEIWNHNCLPRTKVMKPYGCISATWGGFYPNGCFSYFQYTFYAPWTSPIPGLGTMKRMENSLSAQPINDDCHGVHERGLDWWDDWFFELRWWRTSLEGAVEYSSTR